MGRIRTCIGKYATTPYVIKPEGIRIYSYEELCYYLCANAYVLDAEFPDSSLVEWIGSQLQLTALSDALRTMLQNGNAPENFVARILEQGHYCTAGKLHEILQIIRDNSKLNIYEKRKKRIDHLASVGCYEQAYREYEELLPLITGKDIALTGAVYTAMGKLAARMFYFSLAEELFEKAYRLTYRKDSMLYYVCTVKMHGTPQEQRQKLLACAEFQKMEPEADQMLEQCEEHFRETPAYERLQDMERMWDEGKPAEYYELVEKTTEQLKEEYRARTES
ncbi:MAG: hypothetical protein ACI4SE_07215 [Lachnospiraceae bacterium]